MEEIFKVLWLSGEDTVDLIADMIPQFWPLRIICPLYTLMVRLRFNNGQTVFQADPVSDLLQGHVGAMEIAELPPAVQGSGIENDAVMNVRPVGMRSNDEGMPAFGRCQSQLITDTVCFLSGDLSRFKGLPDLIGDHITPLIPPGKLPVLPFGKQELFITGHGIAVIPAITAVIIVVVSRCLPHQCFYGTHTSICKTHVIRPLRCIRKGSDIRFL